MYPPAFPPLCRMQQTKINNSGKSTKDSCRRAFRNFIVRCRWREKEEKKVAVVLLSRSCITDLMQWHVGFEKKKNHGEKMQHGRSSTFRYIVCSYVCRIHVPRAG
jgi:hypothetical protein